MKNLTFLFLFISFLASLESYSQSLSGRVIYKVQVVGYGTNKESKFKEYNAAINEIANKRTLTLTFNSIQSSSVMDRYLISDAENNALNRSASAMAFVLTNGADYFFDKTSSTAVKRYNNARLVKNTHKILEWDITAESKKIDNYLCYKAVYLDKFVNRIGVDTVIPITAWFAPSLPYSYGPKYFNGLPGLILELQDRETTFLASSISISNIEELKIDFPKGKTIDQEEYDKRSLYRNK